MLPYGIRAKNGGFHSKMSEMTSSPERMERVGAFYRIIDSHDLIPLSCKISIGDLAHARSRLLAPKYTIDWGPFEDPFFFTFRAILDNVHSYRDKLSTLPSNEKIDFIFDNNAKKRMIRAYPVNADAR